MTESNKSTEQAATVSVQNNLPNADAGGGNGAGSQTQRQEETTNYEVGRTVRTLVREQPEIRRISIAVLVDGTSTPGPDGKPHWQPRGQDELDRLASLVRGAIGYDQKRGDHVEIVNLRFVDEDAPQVPPKRLFGLDVAGLDFTRVAQTGLFALVAVLAVLIVLRPMARRLAAPVERQAIAGPELDALAAAGEPRAGAGLGSLPPGAVGGVRGSVGGGAGGGGVDETRLLPAPGFGSIGDDGMIDVAHVQGQLRASSIRRIADLVDRHPEECLAIVRGWMQQEAT